MYIMSSNFTPISVAPIRLSIRFKHDHVPDLNVNTWRHYVDAEGVLFE